MRLAGFGKEHVTAALRAHTAAALILSAEDTRPSLTPPPRIALWAMLTGRLRAKRTGAANTNLTPEATMIEELKALADAEQAYRKAHDLYGGGDIRTGRAWDAMRRAGDAARQALAALEPKP